MEKLKFNIRVSLLETETGMPHEEAKKIVLEEMKAERKSQLDAWKEEEAASLAQEEQDKPLLQRERGTLLTIIGVLCKDKGYDVTKHSKTAGLIHSAAASMGISIGDSTIENHLKKIPDVLAGRMK